MSLRASELELALSGFRGTIREKVSLAPLTHLRVGGPADFFLEPKTEEDVALVVRVAAELDQNLHVLGGGSNLVVADEGVSGITMSLAALKQIVQDETRITAGAGVTLPSLLRRSKDQGLAGLEVLVGIPAMVGGAVAMNAGTRSGEIFDHLISLDVVGPGGRIHTLERSELTPRYRDGGLGDRVVLAATFELVPEDSKAIYERTEALLKQRNRTQPVSLKSVGCVFANPEGDFAGRLIEEAGCKLLRRGDICVSRLHANFFVNEGEGTAKDFLGLLAEVQERVEEKFGIRLVPEVQIWGV